MRQQEGGSDTHTTGVDLTVTASTINLASEPPVSDRADSLPGETIPDTITIHPRWRNHWGSGPSAAAKLWLKQTGADPGLPVYFASGQEEEEYAQNGAGSNNSGSKRESQRTQDPYSGSPWRLERERWERHFRAVMSDDNTRSSGASIEPFDAANLTQSSLGHYNVPASQFQQASTTVPGPSAAVSRELPADKVTTTHLFDTQRADLPSHTERRWPVSRFWPKDGRVEPLPESYMRVARMRTNRPVIPKEAPHNTRIAPEQSTHTQTSMEQMQTGKSPAFSPKYSSPNGNRTESDPNTREHTGIEHVLTHRPISGFWPKSGRVEPMPESWLRMQRTDRLTIATEYTDEEQLHNDSQPTSYSKHESADSRSKPKSDPLDAQNTEVEQFRVRKYPVSSFWSKSDRVEPLPATWRALLHTDAPVISKKVPDHPVVEPEQGIAQYTDAKDQADRPPLKHWPSPGRTEAEPYTDQHTDVPQMLARRPISRFWPRYGRVEQLPVAHRDSLDTSTSRMPKEDQRHTVVQPEQDTTQHTDVGKQANRSLSKHWPTDNPVEPESSAHQHIEKKQLPTHKNRPISRFWHQSDRVEPWPEAYLRMLRSDRTVPENLPSQTDIQSKDDHDTVLQPGREQSEKPDSGHTPSQQHAEPSALLLTNSQQLRRPILRFWPKNGRVEPLSETLMRTRLFNRPSQSHVDPGIAARTGTEPAMRGMHNSSGHYPLDAGSSQSQKGRQRAQYPEQKQMSRW